MVQTTTVGNLAVLKGTGLKLWVCFAVLFPPCDRAMAGAARSLKTTTEPYLQAPLIYVSECVPT